MASCATVDIFVGFETSKGSIHFSNPLKFSEKVKLRQDMQAVISGRGTIGGFVETALCLLDAAITLHGLRRQKIEDAMLQYITCCLPNNDFQVNSIPSVPSFD